MKINEMLRLLAFNLAGALLLVFCYASPFLELSYTDRSAFRATCAILIGPAVILLLIIYDIYKLKGVGMTISEADDNDDMEYLLDQYRSTLFSRQAAIAKGQLRLFEKRRQVFLDILNEHDLEDASSFYELAEHLKSQILLNVQKALRIMQVFNYDRYRMQGTQADPAYHAQIQFCNACVATNEQIITQFDELISELSMLQEKQADDSMQRVADMAQSLRQIRTAQGKDSAIVELEKKYH